ncbi:MAG: RimK/LysX family protein [Pseudomonadota bacterium]
MKNIKIMRNIIGLLFSLMLCCKAYAQESPERTIIPEGKPYHLSEKIKKKNGNLSKAGWVEKVCIGNVDFSFNAKLDTGATSSSVNADIIREFERDGKRYVLYRIVNDGQETETFESEVTRYTRIKQKSGAKGIKRAFVIMTFKIGKKTIEGEVNLAERDHFNYPVLVGRNMLENNFYVDAARQNVQKTKCP